MLTLSSADCYLVTPDTLHLVKHPVSSSIVVTAKRDYELLCVKRLVKGFLGVGC